MKKILLVILTASFFCFSGCIESIHSIVPYKTEYLNEKLEGTWIGGFNKSKINYVVVDGYRYNKKWRNGRGYNTTILEDMNELKKANPDLSGQNLIDKYISISSDPIEKKKLGAYKIERSHILKINRENDTTFTIGNRIYKGTNKPTSLFDVPLSICKDSSHLNLEIKRALPYYLMNDSFNRNSGNVSEGNKLDKIIKFTQIGSNIFMELSDKREKNPHRLKGHTVYKIEFKEDKLIYHFFDVAYLSKQLRSNKLRIKHEQMSPSQFVITASTKEMRSFLEKYGDDERLFGQGGGMELRKIPEENIF